MRERAKRASASELGTVYFNEVSSRLVWTAARPVATRYHCLYYIDYIR